MNEKHSYGYIAPLNYNEMWIYSKGPKFQNFFFFWLNKNARKKKKTDAQRNIKSKTNSVEIIVLPPAK